MIKLKIKFAKFENALAMQILEQDESLRNKENDSAKWTCAETGLTISSWANPDFETDAFYIRGLYPSFDHDVSTIYFLSNMQRDQALERYTTALRNFAKAGYFDGKPAEQKQTDDDIIIVV